MKNDQGREGSAAPADIQGAATKTRTFSHGSARVVIDEYGLQFAVGASELPDLLEVEAHDLRRVLTMALDAIARDHGHTLAEADSFLRSQRLVCGAGTCCRPRGHAGQHDQFDGQRSPDSLDIFALAAGCVLCGAQPPESKLMLVVTDVVEAVCDDCNRPRRGR